MFKFNSKKPDSFLQEEHNIEIQLIDHKLNELIVYKSPTLYLREKNSGKLLIKAKDEFSCCKIVIKNDLVKWSIKGNWCEYIACKINELEVEINNRKFKSETEKIIFKVVFNCCDMLQKNSVINSLY
ncbi:MAG: hypothetical protein ACREVX_11705 [Clostridium sp.]|uniref:hypothetical protein n=1 Tax=Clostridium sp. TaxID=1506 RepID=UPI003D6CBC36